MNCIAESGSTANFLYYWLWCCVHSHFRAQIETANGAKVRKKKGEREDMEMVSKLRRSAAKASDFISDVIEAVDVCGLPKTVLRIHWMDINVLDLYYDSWRGISMNFFVRGRGKKWQMLKALK